MKLLLTLTSLMLVSSVLFLSCTTDYSVQPDVVLPCLPVELQKNVVTYYPFSKGSLRDFTNYHHDLINISAAKPTTDRNGNPRCAYEFWNNYFLTKNYLVSEDARYLNNLKDFSISLWYCPLDSFRYWGTAEYLLNFDPMMRVIVTEGSKIKFYNNKKSIYEIYSEPPLERVGKWGHITATFENSSNTLRLYRNGIFIDSTIAVDRIAGSEPMYIGMGYIGKIDDIIIFNKTLNKEEINMVYNQPSCSQ